MLSYKEIETTIRNKNFSMKYFIPEVLGMTSHGFKLAVERRTLKVKDLERLSDALKLPITYWFKAYESGSILNEPSIYYTESEAVKEWKERAIRNEKTIDILQNEIITLREKYERKPEKQKERKAG
jgi:hypothetical protein